MSYRIYSWVVLIWLLLIDGLIIRYYMPREQLYVFRVVMSLLLTIGICYYAVQKWRNESSVEDSLWKIVLASFICLFWTVMILLRYF